MNHVWLRHFGRPLVEDVFDFGLNSPRPVHHELLDWLAREFIDPAEPESGIGSGGWRMKALHRLIVTSRVYRLSSSSDDAVTVNREIDPDNLYYWRANVRRLESEVIRDSVLVASRTLDRTLGGEDLDYKDGELTPRRSLYYRTAYEKQMLFLQVFDGASPTECYRRTESIVPQQALALANSPLTPTHSRTLARDLWAASKSEPESHVTFVRSAFERILARQPEPKEERACLAYLKRQSTNLLDRYTSSSIQDKQESHLTPADRADRRAREDLVQVLFNHNDFVTVR